MAEKENNGTDLPVEGQVLCFDHIVFWVANARAVSTYFVACLGFQPLAVRKGTKKRLVESFVVKLNQITILFQSPVLPEAKLTKDIIAHGDFVKDVAFEVQNLEELVQRAKVGGAEVDVDVTEDSDEFGVVRYAVVKTYGDNTHTLIDRSKYKGIFWPNFEPADKNFVYQTLYPTNLRNIDHVECNVSFGVLEKTLSWYKKILNMHRFWCVDYNHDVSKYSTIESAAVINKNENVLLSMNEPATAKKTGRAIQFLKSHKGAGVEHIALYTDDIVTTIRNVRARGGEIIPVPPTYYDLIREKLKDSTVNVLETIEAMKECDIMIDFDENGYMLQAFTNHIQARPTLFIEFVQRRNHTGFGVMNFKWIFEALRIWNSRPPTNGYGTKKNVAA